MRNLDRFIFLLFISCLLIFSRNNLHAQQPNFQIVKGLPTNEVYDLLIDSKGLLWIAHDQGLSRYDGKTFKHFTNPEQSGRGISGLIEDKYGRVWCYNFNDQVFWVKDDVMHLLNEFDAGDVPQLPRITICNNELFAIKNKNLFIYDLALNKGRYISLPEPVMSMCAVKDHLYAAALNGWYIYTKGKPLEMKNWRDVYPKFQGMTLVSESFSKDDTIFSIEQLRNRYCSFVVGQNAAIKFAGEGIKDTYINTIGIDRDERWLHTKISSYNLSTGQQIDGYNITDVITDKEGNKWFSSLKTGLMMLPGNNTKISKLNLPLRKGDYVRNTAVLGNQIIFGTQGGDVFIHDQTTGKHKSVFSKRGVGAIERLYVYDSSHILITPSIGLFLLNLKTNNIKPILLDIPVKDVSFTKGYTAISSNRGVILMSSLYNIADTAWMRKARNDFKGLVSYAPDISALTWIEERCRSTVFSPFDESIFTAYRSGLYQCRQGKYPNIVKFNGSSIKASALVTGGNKIFITTATNELLVQDINGVHLLSARDNAENVLQLIIVGDQLWVVTTYGIKAIDIATEKIVGYYELTGINPASIMDIKKAGNNVVIALPDAVCAIPMEKAAKLSKPIISLSYVIVNGKDTLSVDQHVLAYNESDVRFHLSAPWYSNSNAIQIAYRLIGNADTSWQYIPRTDDPVYYASLSPGEYRFEARAVHLLSNYSSAIVSLDFIIEKPWWKSNVFLVAVFLLLSLGIISVIRRYYRERLIRQRHYYERELAVEKERQRISTDIHDELGGTLSGIRLMIEITERKYFENDSIENQLRDMHASVSSLTLKLREVIWSLNKENNSLESLLDYILRKAKEIVINGKVGFSGYLPEEIPAISISGEKRRCIYLSVKDALTSMLKQVGVKNIFLTFVVHEKKALIITMKDDGGTDSYDIAEEDMFKKIRQRMKQTKSILEIKTNDTREIVFEILLEED